MKLSLELHKRTILFVTSNDIEKEALVAELAAHGATMQRRPIGLLTRVRVGVLAGYPVCLLSAERGSHGPASVGMLLPEVLQALDPQLVILSGFCYGNPATENLHNVIVSNRIVSLVDFIAKEGALQIRSQPTLDSPISNEKLSALVGLITPSFAQKVKAKGLFSEIVTGTVYSGEIFSADEKFSSTLFEADSAAVAGDMEGQPVAANCCKRRTPWLFVKSPSDNGAGTQGTRNAQRFSAMLAAIASCRLAIEFARTEKLSAPQPLVSYLGSSGPEPLVDLVEGSVTHKLMANKPYAKEIAGFVDQCSIDVVYCSEFRSHLTAVLKEMVENSITWGKSTRVQLQGGSHEILLSSNGHMFNPLVEFPKMVVGGGGKRDLDTFLEAYGPTGSAIIEVDWHAEHGVQYLKFNFNRLTGHINQRYFCTLMLTPKDLLGYAFSHLPLVDLSSCKEVWLDANSLYLSGSDGPLMSALCQKIPKTVERIFIRNVNPRYMKAFKEFCSFDSRVIFI